METDLVKRENLSPAEVVETATTQAKLLMDIVEKTGCFQEISGKKYLQVEAWETIGAFNRTHAETESISPITKDNEIVGYQAKVQLWKDGVVIGGAIMPCYFTENCCKGKEGDAKHKSSMSAAQTFATSKAYRMNFSYVAILAGYQPLPAEEVTADMQDKTQHWCKEHETPFFKKGKMKWYAHKIEGSDEWCNENKKTQPEPPPEALTDIAEPTEPPNSLIDMDWLSESLKNLEDNKVSGWDKVSILGYMKVTYKVEAETALEAASKLDKGQAAHFVKGVEAALALI